MRITLRYSLSVAVLTAAYYLIASAVFGRLPYVSPHSWWLSLFPSRRLGVLAWFQAMNVVGAFVAAVPIALLLTWRVPQYKQAAALIIGSIVTAAVIIQAVALYTPLPAHAAPASVLWLNYACLAGSLFFAVPLVTRFLAILPSNQRWSDRERK
jgi:hypothetical protein